MIGSIFIIFVLLYEGNIYFKMKLVLVLAFSCLSYYNIYAQIAADSVLNALTIQEKVSMLFVQQSDVNADSLCLGVKESSRISLFDARYGFQDSLALPFPNKNTLIANSDKSLSEALALSALFAFKDEGYDGILITENENKLTQLAFNADDICEEASFRVIDFPCNALISKMAEFRASKKQKKHKYGDAFSLGKMDLINSIDSLKVDVSYLLHEKILFWDSKENGCQAHLLYAIANGIIKESDLDAAIKRLMISKMANSDNKQFSNAGAAELKHRYKAYQNSISIWQKSQLLPIKHLDTLSVKITNYSQSDSQQFNKRVSYYHPKVSFDKGMANMHMVLFDDKDSLRLNLNKAPLTSSETQVNLLVYIGEMDRDLLSQIGLHFDVLVTMPELIEPSWDMLAQAIYSGFAVNGGSAYSKELLSKSYAKTTVNKARLGFRSELLAGLCVDSITKIDSIIHNAIKEQATPGAQLVVVNKGDIILQKSYGFHTYDKQIKVDDNDLYDVASITKLAVTFPLVMQMFDKGSLDLEATLVDYIPSLDTTDKADISIKQLLLHQAGLSSYIPFHYNFLDKESLRKRPLYSRHYSRLYSIRVDTRLYQNKNARFRKEVFAKSQTSLFNKQVAAGIYMSDAYVDSMYVSIYNSPLRASAEYLYSDLGYYILQKVIEDQEKQTVDSLFYKNLSCYLGADRLVYNPLHRFDSKQIVPTENDLAFRKELLDGFVHDQGAAMLGGVAAHAGLFANAGDLAKLGQMLLSEGQYGGIRLINPKTIGLFTQTANHGNRRGIGVDKPPLEPEENSHVSQRVSPSSYGHTGFTGTMLWIDPDNDLIYIFLSNRIHPRAYNKKLIEMNVRTKIQDVIYNSIKD